MNREQMALLKLMEECNEVSQRCAKAIKFGLEEKQPGQELTNRQRLYEEAVDVIAALDVLTDRGILDMDKVTNPEVAARKEKITKYDEYSRSLGILKD